ncbi:MAG: MFS transporter [Aquabacterium sp.]
MTAVPQHDAAGVRALFVAAGALFATWGVHVPTVKAHYGVGEQALGMAMLATGVGACAGLSQAGRLIHRHGVQRVLWVAGVLSPAAIAMLLAGDAFSVVLWALFAFGLISSTFDVAMNVAATDVERQAGRPVMSGFHGMFSAGGMAGAAFGGAALQAGMRAELHLWTASLLCWMLAWWGAARVATHVHDDEVRPALFWRASRPLVVTGVLAALGLLCEGAMYDWSVLFARERHGAGAGASAWAYASFSAAMAAGRFGGDWVRARMSAARLLRLSALLAAAGMGVALASPHLWLTLAGFAGVGLGLANVVPLLFVAAGRVPGVTPASGIAVVSAMGYLGMMGGPALIGLVAQHHGLTVALAQVLLLALVLAVAAGKALGRV